MVVYKSVESAADGFEALNVMGYFEVIVVVVAGVNAFVQLIIGDGMKHLIVHPSAVITVNHFAHQPEILFHGSGLAPQLFHEAEVKHVGAVEADSVDIEGIDPEPDRVK